MAIVGGAALTVMVVIIIVNIIMRRFFNSSIMGSTEMVSYLSLFIGSIGLGHQEWTDNNITMTILLDAQKPRIRSLQRAVISFICFIGFSVVSFYLTCEAVSKGVVGELTPTLRIPMVIPTGFMAACFIFLCICLAVECVLYFLGFLKNDFTEVESDSLNT